MPALLGNRESLWTAWTGEAFVSPFPAPAQSWEPQGLAALLQLKAGHCSGEEATTAATDAASTCSRKPPDLLMLRTRHAASAPASTATAFAKGPTA